MQVYVPLGIGDKFSIPCDLASFAMAIWLVDFVLPCLHIGIRIPTYVAGLNHLANQKGFLTYFLMAARPVRTLLERFWVIGKKPTVVEL